jgi:hypothetical protein
MMSDSTPAQADDLTLQNVLLAFAAIFPEPTDDQTHALAGLLGYEKQEFLDLARKILAPLLNGDDESTPQANDDPIETFLLAFYLINPEPSEEQLEVLALLMELTLEELESRTYSAIVKLTEAQPTDGVSNLNTLDDNFIADDDDDEDFDPDAPLTDGEGNVIQLI